MPVEKLIISFFLSSQKSFLIKRPFLFLSCVAKTAYVFKYRSKIFFGCMPGRKSIYNYCHGNNIMLTIIYKHSGAKG
uniref:Uncharacterized protein n=1 Tax=uncultured Desulfobacterium sp. TaxID=201089 RepID=E1YF39_9BACT|nr:unknown protein [uncultured Desulfobacterium sp.]